MPFNPQDTSIGQEKPGTEAYDKAMGEYKGNVPRGGNAGATLPDMPQAPDPSPFSIGPMAPGGR